LDASGSGIYGGGGGSSFISKSHTSSGHPLVQEIHPSALPAAASRTHQLARPGMAGSGVVVSSQDTVLYAAIGLCLLDSLPHPHAIPTSRLRWRLLLALPPWEAKQSCFLPAPAGRRVIFF
jgi:hypothetical protein